MTEGNGSGSVAFDRAADVYDRTRPISAEGLAATTELVAAEFRGRGRCLEVGVGTGVIALSLAEAGISMAGVDVAKPMVDKLVEKAGGWAPFPLAVGDATRLPFRDATFGGAVMRHVLHLIPGWRGAVEEVVRVVRPGGVLVVNLGFYYGAFKGIIDRYVAEAGPDAGNIGLDAGEERALDATMKALGAGARVLEPVAEQGSLTVAAFLDQIDARVPSWTWRTTDEAHRRAASAARAWAVRRHDDLDRVADPEILIPWRAYDLHS